MKFQRKAIKYDVKIQIILKPTQQWKTMIVTDDVSEVKYSVNS